MEYYDGMPYEADDTEEEYVRSEVDDSAQESKILKAYMEDISLLKTYSDKEKLELYGKLLDGERDAIDTISAVWLSGVLDIAKKYMDVHAKVEDLIQEGNLALLIKLSELCGTKDIAADGLYDDENGLDYGQSLSLVEKMDKILSESAEKGIMDYISMWNGEKEQENALAGKLSLIHEATAYLEEQYGIAPTIEELSEYTKIPVDELSGYVEYMKRIE